MPLDAALTHNELEKLLFDESPDALIGTTPVGVVRYWSKGAETTFGYSNAEVIGRNLTELVVPADRREEDSRKLAECLAQGSTTHEGLRRCKDGSLIYVDITSSIVRSPDGKVVMVVSTQKDVTQLRLLRDTKILETRFRDLVESTPDAIVMVNQTGRIVLVNSHAEQLFGYERGGLLGKPVETLLPARYRSVHVGHRAGFIDQPRVRTMGADLDLFGLRVDGSEFPVEISLSPLHTEDGTLVMSAIRDATQRRNFENELHTKNLELANANQAKDRFLASMSHELRTPLNAIIGFTGTLLMKLPGPLNADQEKQLRTVQVSAKHLLSLINDMLDLAKIEAGKLELDIETADCKQVLEEVLAALRPQAVIKRLQINLTMPEADLMFPTDRRALRQIIFNLVNNAIKFTDEGQVSITLQHHIEPNSHLVLQVADTGSGLRPEDQENLFSAFSRISVPGQRSEEGTGLGLHVSQNLARLLGGEISLQSEFGHGSTFTLKLPEAQR